MLIDVLVIQFSPLDGCVTSTDLPSSAVDSRVDPAQEARVSSHQDDPFCAEKDRERRKSQSQQMLARKHWISRLNISSSLALKPTCIVTTIVVTSQNIWVGKHAFDVHFTYKH